MSLDNFKKFKEEIGEQKLKEQGEIEIKKVENFKNIYGDKDRDIKVEAVRKAVKEKKEDKEKLSDITVKREKAKKDIKTIRTELKAMIKGDPKIAETLRANKGEKAKEVMSEVVENLNAREIAELTSKLEKNRVSIVEAVKLLTEDIDKSLEKIKADEPSFEGLFNQAQEVMRTKEYIDNQIKKYDELYEKVKSAEVYQILRQHKFDVEKMRLEEIPNTGMKVPIDISKHIIAFRSGSYHNSIRNIDERIGFYNKTSFDNLNNLTQAINELNANNNNQLEQINSLKPGFLESSKSFYAKRNVLNQEREKIYQENYTKNYNQKRFYEKLEFAMNEGYRSYHSSEEGIDSKIDRLINDINNSEYPIKLREFFDANKDYTFADFFNIVKEKLAEKKNELKIDEKSETLYNAVDKLNKIKRELEGLRQQS